MKLALALNERAELTTKISELSKRLNANALVQENEKPAEDPAELQQQLNECLIRFEELSARINQTNSVTQVKRRSLTACLAKRDCLKRRVSVMRSFLEAASNRVDGYFRGSIWAFGYSEIKICSTVSVPELRKQVDSWAKELRLLNQDIQEANWLTELI